MLPRIEHLPPLSFLPTPTVCSSRNPAGLLHPASSHGVRVVSCRASRFQFCNLPPSSWLFPNSPFAPSKVFPSSIAALRLRNRCHSRRSTGVFHFHHPHRSASRSRFQRVTSFPAPNVATSAVPLITLSPTSRPCSIAESVAAAVCCHSTSTRYSLGLCSPPGRSPRPQCPFTDTPPRSPCRNTKTVTRCPDRPLCDFRPMNHRCRRHPAFHQSAFQRPSRRRSGVHSTCFRRRTAETTRRLQARSAAPLIPKHHRYRCTDCTKHEPHSASHPSEDGCATCLATEAT